MFRFLSTNRGLSFPVIVLSGVICAFFFVAGFLAIRWMSSRWSPTLKNSERLLKEGKYDEALAVASELDSEDGAAVDVVIGKIWLARAYRRYRKEEWKSYGTNPDDWFTGADVAKALTHFRGALSLEPSHTEARYYLGIIYMEKGWHSRAETQFMETLRVDREHVDAHVSLAALYVKMERYREAEQELIRAHELAPENPAVAKNLSFLYRFYLDDPKAAMEWSNRYLNLEPRGDPQQALIQSEFADMIRRYPEYAPPREEQKWRKDDPSFEPRKTPFSK